MISLFQVRSECPLGQLLAREAALGREIRALDSDMQTLLYENYNKFISATGGLSGGTQAFGGGDLWDPKWLRDPWVSFFSLPPDTIRKMKVDFRRMEAEMDDLAANMAAISTSSARVSAALQDRHRRGAQLAGMGREEWSPGGQIYGVWGQILGLGDSGRTDCGVGGQIWGLEGPGD